MYALLSKKACPVQDRLATIPIQNFKLNDYTFLSSYLPTYLKKKWALSDLRDGARL